MNRYFAEIFGTFAMVFAGTGAVVIDAVTRGGVTHVGVAVTFGLIVMAMIYTLGDISGSHMNPAVTIGFFFAGRLPGRFVAPYVASQLVGALGASLLLRAMFSNAAYLGATLPAGSALQSFVLEVVLTAILMFVVLCVSTGPKEIGVMAGIAIGGVVGLEAMFAGPISGASMNPARSLAPALVCGHLQSLWIYILAPTLGALIAIPCWRLTRGSTKEHLPDKSPASSLEEQYVEH
jgi:aquaporin NIP